MIREVIGLRVVIEGNGGSAHNDVYSYDYNTDTWTQEGDMPDSGDFTPSLGAYDSESDRIVAIESNGASSTNDVYAGKEYLYPIATLASTNWPPYN